MLVDLVFYMTLLYILIQFKFLFHVVLCSELTFLFFCKTPEDRKKQTLGAFLKVNSTYKLLSPPSHPPPLKKKNSLPAYTPFSPAPNSLHPTFPLHCRKADHLHLSFSLAPSSTLPSTNTFYSPLFSPQAAFSSYHIPNPHFPFAALKQTPPLPPSLALLHPVTPKPSPDFSSPSSTTKFSPPSQSFPCLTAEQVRGELRTFRP